MSPSGGADFGGEYFYLWVRRIQKRQSRPSAALMDPMVKPAAVTALAIGAGLLLVQKIRGGAAVKEKKKANGGRIPESPDATGAVPIILTNKLGKSWLGLGGWVQGGNRVLKRQRLKLRIDLYCILMIKIQFTICMLGRGPVGKLVSNGWGFVITTAGYGCFEVK